MIVYLAGEAYGEKVFRKAQWKFNRLDSFYYVRKNEAFQANIPKYNRYLLDSGAFTFIMGAHDTKIDINSFTDEYIDFIKRHKIDLFFEMDVDAVYGYELVKKLRKRIEQGTGKPTIPVYHMNRGLDDFKAMCKDYDYIALGVAGKEFAWGDWKSFSPFVMEAIKHGTKMHGLGITGMNVLDKVPFYSVDSSSWTAGNRYKTIFRFDGQQVKTLKEDLSNKRIHNHLGLAHHNFREWVKFAEWAEVNL